MNNQLGALSTDLRRISYWVYEGRDVLAKKFLERDIQLYGDLQIDIGKLSLRETLDRIASMSEGRMKAAERALTASVILLSRSGRIGEI